MKFAKWMSAAAVAATTILGAATASADGLVAAPGDLPPKARAELKAAIAEHEKDDPASFEAVRNVKGHKPEVYEEARRPTPMLVVRELRRLGPSAVLPMLEALAFDVWDRGSATDAERRALARGMMLAVGYHGHPRGSVVLEAAFDGADHAKIALSAAKSLGKICDDRALGTLEASVSGAKRGAAIAGLGECRREEAAKALVAELDAADDAAEAAVIARALGSVSSSWAWKAMGDEREAEGLRVRKMATAALVRGFARFGGKTERAMRVGLTMAAHPAIRTIAGRHRGPLAASKEKRLEAVIASVERRAKR